MGKKREKKCKRNCYYVSEGAAPTVLFSDPTASSSTVVYFILLKHPVVCFEYFLWKEGQF